MPAAMGCFSQRLKNKFKTVLVNEPSVFELRKFCCTCILQKYNKMFQDVFLMIRRKKTTIFTDAKESTTVLEVKRIVEGILKQKIEDQRLYKDDQVKRNGHIP